MPLISVVIVDASGTERALQSAVLRIYRVVGIVSVKEVLGSGFELLPTFRTPHYSVLLPDTSNASVDKLVDIFRKKVENPFYER